MDGSLTRSRRETLELVMDTSTPLFGQNMGHRTQSKGRIIDGHLIRIKKSHRPEVKIIKHNDI